ncbi:MAG: ATP-binding cassette domain-containing protein [Firmicutes bacterium]|nr:ATP-binding cassette domain-containing protein [Bacillota bacterium]
MLDVKLKKRLPGFTLEVAFKTNREILAILGPSGSGKTMTLRCIAGLISPDEGYVESNGRVLLDSGRGIGLPPQQRRVGFVFQNYALFPHLTVSENVAFGMDKRSKRQVDDSVSNLLGKMRISELASRYPGQLSAGQQQRVALARALAPEPEVLLLDEPFSALDAQVKERLEQELLEVQQFYRGTMLYVTHDLAEAYRLCSKMAVYEAGRILQLGPKQEVIESPVNRTVASSTGVKNLYEAFIADIEDSAVWVQAPGLGRGLRIENLGRAGYVKNQNVAVGIRQEYVRFADSPGENVLSGTLVQVMEGTAMNSYRFLLDGEAASPRHLEVSCPRWDAPAISPGEKHPLLLPPERLFITSLK